MKRTRLATADLHAAWEENASAWARWATTPRHDSFWQFPRSAPRAPAAADEVDRGGLEMTFTSVHRPLEADAEALAGAELVIDRLREPAVPTHAVTKSGTRRWQRVPLFLHVRAVKGQPASR